MQQAHKQTGSAHVIVIAILAVALAGTLGTVFYQNFVAKKADDTNKAVDNASKTNTESTPTSQMPDTAPKTTQPEVQQVDASKYLAFDDWSVKFTLPQDGTGILYQKYNLHTVAGTYDEYLFTTKVVNGYGGYCVLDNARPGSALMAIERRSEKYSGGPAAQMPLNNGESLNGYYYYILPSAGSACSQANEAKILADRETLRQLARTLTVK